MVSVLVTHRHFTDNRISVKAFNSGKLRCARVTNDFDLYSNIKRFMENLAKLVAYVRFTAVYTEAQMSPITFHI